MATSSLLTAHRIGRLMLWGALAVFALGILMLFVGMVGFLGGILVAFTGASYVGEGVELPISEPETIVVDPDGNIFLGLMFYERIQVYDKDGKYIRGWFVPNTGGGLFSMRPGPGDTLEVLTARTDMLFRYTSSGEEKYREKLNDDLWDKFNEECRKSWTDRNGVRYELRGKNFGPSLYPNVVRINRDGSERVVVSTHWYLWPFQGAFPAFLFAAAGMIVSTVGMAAFVVSLILRKSLASKVSQVGV